MGKLKLRDITPEERDQYAIAIHEAAHAITASVYGCQVSRVALTPDHDQRAGHCDVIEQFAGVYRAHVAFSGPYAEAYWRHGGPPPSAILRAALTRHTDDNTAIVASGEPRPPEVPRLVASCWPSITGLARHLFIHGSATQGDVDRALFLPEHEPEPREFALASIRSGRVPGSFKIVPAALT